MKKSVALLSAALVSAGLTLFPATSQAALPLAVDGQALPSLAPMISEVGPAVVSVSVKGTQVSKQQLPDAFRYFFGPNAPRERVQERPFQGLGSGVIIDADDGYIVTNHHVIDGADEILVSLNDGREFEAKLIGSDRGSDIALLQIEADDLTEVKLASSDNLRVGDFAVAIGNPFGLGQTVTSGIVSALGRSGLNIESLENFIQTDAAINSGNSGGALVNLKGELIGINTAILAPSGGNVGIGFAIPSNMVKGLTQQIIEFGEVRRGVLGVLGRELDNETAKLFGLESQHGAFISQVVPDSAADKAGLKAGDIIVSVNGKKIKTFSELRAKVATLGAGTTVKLGIIRDGDEDTYKVTLSEAEGENVQASVVHPALEGAKLSTYNQDGIKGVVISEIAERSPAARQGLEEGDVIVGVNRKRIESLKELRNLLEDYEGALALNIRRDGSSMYLIVR
ncbi:Do family serine endopeptidase [Ferrimonas aestuarii]|uniref:Do family serine endopeptidase n=1 Tax=Ferrimonas aestuarii TaxID=2569539 RepID=A0A4U1BPS3_9GAMM|nr:Do family serine endopeptidase [Ferrimonas aestuarii]TKB55950.1 Do family serine endopeptidase [Ferrimonas aestuarii]